MTAYDLYREAKLEEAIAAAVQRVKTAPSDVDGRLLLCDLLCFDNQFERADRQLDLLAEQDSGLAGGVAVYRHIIRAELARGEVFKAGRVPEFFGGITEPLKLHLAASIAIRDGQVEEAGSLLRQAEQQRPPVRGECDGQPFEELRDLDDVTAPFLEVLTSTGKYYWIAWERIQALEFRPTKYLRDLLWRQADMSIRSGPDALVFVPVLYPGSHQSQDPEVRLGRRTDWLEGIGGTTTGMGQRTLLVGEVDKTILSIGTISFSGEANPSAAV